MIIRYKILTMLILATSILQAQSIHKAAAEGKISTMDSLYHLNTGVLTETDAQSGGQAIHFAAWAGEQSSIDWLVNKGADLNVKDSNGSTVFAWAIAGGRISVMKKIVECGVEIIGNQDKWGNYLHVAAMHGHSDVIDYLVHAGLDVNLSGRFGFVPLHNAVFRRQAVQVAALLKNGADAMKLNQDGISPLFMAAGLGNAQLINIFLENGTSVNSVTQQGGTLLHAAVHGGHIELVKTLIEAGADLQIIDGANLSPLDLAIERRHAPVAELLTANGAKKNNKQTDARTAFPPFVTLGKSLDNEISVSVIYDNFVHVEGMEADWGFSLLIEGAEKTILFDTGTSPDLFLKNFDAMKLKSDKVDIAVLSHEHGDHTGGLFNFLKRKSGIPVLMPHSFSYSFVSRVASAGAQPVTSKEPIKICDGIYTSGEMGDAIKEHCLVLDTKKGLVVITGCSHPGIADMLEIIKQTFDKYIYMVFGGFHLMQKTDADMAVIIQKMKDMGVKKCGATHCTGNVQIELFKEAFGENYVPLGVGNVIRF
ncbi:ankyrin repeat domain-containing protein [bacterium]|nr:ankyrin repeat domain-containing protein [bacterium]